MYNLQYTRKLNRVLFKTICWMVD